MPVNTPTISAPTTAPAAVLGPVTAAPTNPLAYAAAINNMVQLAAPPLAGSQPGWLHLWDAASGNMLRQYSVPFVDAVAPQLILTYNSAAATGSGSPLSPGWFLTFFDSVSGSGTTATVFKGNGASVDYTGKNATTGVYTTPFGVVNQLKQNADNTWTETQPDGYQFNYATSGKLATIKRAANTWTMLYDSGGKLEAILDPVSRRSCLVYGAGLVNIHHLGDIMVTQPTPAVGPIARVFLKY